ncbi:HAMP domain-containing sensor histidine kinase [Micromonospora sp. M12]
MAEALESKIAALSAAQARERQFTADVAHELRTPVTALVAAASLLREHLDQLPDDARPAARLLVGDVVRLRRLVEDLMEISRLDAGREQPAVVAVDALPLLHGIIAARGWSPRVRVSGDSVTLRTDPRRLERVLANLVANATEHGGGEIRATVAVAGGWSSSRSPTTGRASRRSTSRVFDRFHQVDRSRSTPGSGLGLAIAREHAVLLGGTLGCAAIRSTARGSGWSCPPSRTVTCSVRQGTRGPPRRPGRGGRRCG